MRRNSNSSLRRSSLSRRRRPCCRRKRMHSASYNGAKSWKHSKTWVIPYCLHAAVTSAGFKGSRPIFVASLSVPAFPGAANKPLMRELCENFQTKACSLAPDPKTSTFKIFLLLRVRAVRLVPHRIQEPHYHSWIPDMLQLMNASLYFLNSFRACADK